MASTLPVDLTSVEDLHQAQSRISTTCLRTPVLHLPSHSPGGSPLWIKAESLQHTGSFKLRGATNAVAALGDDASSAGVVGYSAGNHGRGWPGRPGSPESQRRW